MLEKLGPKSNSLLLAMALIVGSSCQSESLTGGSAPYGLTLDAVRVTRDTGGFVFSSTLRNITRSSKELSVSRVAKGFNPVVSTHDGSVIWGAQYHAMTLEGERVIIPPRDSLALSVRWNGRTNRGILVTPGNYLLHADLTGLLTGTDKVDVVAKTEAVSLLISDSQ